MAKQETPSEYFKLLATMFEAVCGSISTGYF